MNRQPTVLRIALLVMLVPGLLAAGCGQAVTDDGSEDPTVEDAQERRDTASRLAGVASRTLRLAGSGLVIGLGMGLFIGGVASYGYWIRRFRA